MFELFQMIALAYYNYEAEKRFVGTETWLNVGCQEFGFDEWEAARWQMSQEEMAEWAILFDAEGHDIQYGIQEIFWIGPYPEELDALAGHP